MDIKVTKGLASVGNEELRDWTEKGWHQAMREGNYDRSREHLNFEIRPGGMGHQRSCFGRQRRVERLDGERMAPGHA